VLPFPGASPAVVHGVRDGIGEARDHRTARPTITCDGPRLAPHPHCPRRHLAIINATYVYAQLVAVHVGERGQAIPAFESQDAAPDASVEVKAHTVADLDRRVSQIDATIDEAAKRGQTTRALAAAEPLRKPREMLAAQREDEGTALADLKAERAALGARSRQVESEDAPIRYSLSFLVLKLTANGAIRWLILMIVLRCDPLATAFQLRLWHGAQPPPDCRRSACAFWDASLRLAGMARIVLSCA
jgi:hypothetical protein